MLRGGCSRRREERNQRIEQGIQSGQLTNREVSNLEKGQANVNRKEARRVVEGKTEKLIVNKDVIKDFLGNIQVRVDTEIEERVKRPGVAVGLAESPAPQLARAKKVRSDRAQPVRVRSGGRMRHSRRHSCSTYRASDPISPEDPGR